MVWWNEEKEKMVSFPVNYNQETRKRMLAKQMKEVKKTRVNMLMGDGPKIPTNMVKACQSSNASTSTTWSFGRKP